MESSTFSLDDYDCIGFDLDCTLAEYNVKELIKLIYHLLADYLVKHKSYDTNCLLSSHEEEEYFFQKGLFLDFKKGNVLKMGENGEIQRATHGTTCLSNEDIVKQYGPNKVFSIFQGILQDPLLAMKSPYEKLLRGTLDCFDLACTLIFAKIVDHLDKNSNGSTSEYNIWPDILAGLYHLYNRNNFATGESEFFAALKKNPELYYKKWTSEKLAWLKDLKSKKFIFLLTGSYIDFANLTAGYCIGENWKDYFDVVLCYARKPSFFFSAHPFFYVVNEEETQVVKEEFLEINSVYSQGNWEKLKHFIAKATNLKQPKCLYIGDNIILDVYTPVHFKCCHSVAVSVELNDEFKSSRLWGSYFGDADKGSSYWNDLIKRNAVICVSGLDVFVQKPLSYRYNCLKPGEITELNEKNGYHVI